jgi:putative ABC transport system permease protein
MNSWMLDVRSFLRQAVHNPGFTLSVVIVLALGVGISAAMFSIVQVVLLKPLPYPNPRQLVQLESLTRKTGEKYTGVAYADIMSWQEQSHNFSGMGAYRFSLLNFGRAGQPEALYGLSVSWRVLPLLGVPPALGRWFQPEEDRPGHTHEVILSDDLWQRSLHSDPHVVGTTIRLNNEDYEVIGVMPPGFNFPDRLATSAHLPTTQMQFWRPLGADLSKEVHGSGHAAGIARLKDGVAFDQGVAELDAVSKRLEAEFPQTNSGLGATAIPLFDASVGSVRPALIMLSAAIGLILLIACANLASLLLARGESRRQESTVRLALGASSWRMLRLVITEAQMLAAAGWVTGCMVAVVILRLLLRLAPVNTPRIANARIDLSVVLFAAGLTFILGLFLSIAPMLQLLRRDPAQVLSEAVRGSSTGRGRVRVRNSLVVGEIALALLLVSGTGLLLRSFVNLTSVDLGFSPNKVAMSVISLSSAKYPKRDDKILFFHNLLDRLAAVPGVEVAAASLGLPVSGQYFDAQVRVEGRSPAGSAADLHTDFNEVSPGYFDALSIPLREGRKFTNQDTADSPLVAVIDEQMAHDLWPHEDALGKRISIEESGSLLWREVVGVVGTTRNYALDQPAQPGMYVPAPQGARAPVFIVVRSSGSPDEAIRRVRETVTGIDPEQPLFLASSMPTLLADSISNRQFMLTLLASFGISSLVLAALGIFGVISYTVAQRVREIGIRMALGAQRTDVVKMVLVQALFLIGCGLTIGMTAFLLTSQLLRSFFFGVSGHDPLVLAIVLLCLTLVSVSAAYLPARRAASIDPLRALRLE